MLKYTWIWIGFRGVNDTAGFDSAMSMTPLIWTCNYLHKTKMLYYMNKESRCVRIMKKRGSKTSRRCPFKRAKSAIVRWKVKGSHTNAIVRSTKESFEKCKLRLCNQKTKTRAHLWNVLYLEALALYAERVLVDRYQVRVGDDVIGWAIPSNSKNIDK